MISPVRIFLAGATGAVGRSMCRMLDGLGYEVFGMTRSPEKAAFLESVNVTPVIADVYDADRVAALLATIGPQIVVHQLTDLPYGVPADKMAEAPPLDGEVGAPILSRESAVIGGLCLPVGQPRFLQLGNRHVQHVL